MPCILVFLIGWYAVTSRRSFGTNVYDLEWDVLIILDACRVDALRAVAEDYEFIDRVDEMWSVGSRSDEWMSNTFTTDLRSEVNRTHYVTGNGHVEKIFRQKEFPPENNTPPLDLSRWRVVNLDAFGAIDDLWQTHHDETYHTVLPRDITDHAIRAGREHDAGRLMIHYMQPHRPYVGRAVREGRKPTAIEREGYKRLESGDASHEAVYEAYMDTLRFVLDDVRILLENLDAERVLITADHGEAFGELGAYGHPEGFLHPAVRKVPVVATTASDKRTREVDIDARDGIAVNLEEHLADLGYR
jgi:hypothetical protein